MTNEAKTKGRNRLERAGAWLVRHRAETLATATTMVLTAPVPAFAVDGVGMLNNVIKLLKGGIGFAGGAMIVWGAVQVGTNLSNGANGNSASISQGIFFIIGGVVVAAASIFLSQLDTGWIATE